MVVAAMPHCPPVEHRCFWRLLGHKHLVRIATTAKHNTAPNVGKHSLLHATKRTATTTLTATAFSITITTIRSAIVTGGVAPIVRLAFAPL